MILCMLLLVLYIYSETTIEGGSSEPHHVPESPRSIFLPWPLFITIQPHAIAHSVTCMWHKQGGEDEKTYFSCHNREIRCKSVQELGLGLVTNNDNGWISWPTIFSSINGVMCGLWNRRVDATAKALVWGNYNERLSSHQTSVNMVIITSTGTLYYYSTFIWRTTIWSSSTMCREWLCLLSLTTFCNNTTSCYCPHRNMYATQARWRRWEDLFLPVITEKLAVECARVGPWPCHQQWQWWISWPAISPVLMEQCVAFETEEWMPLQRPLSEEITMKRLSSTRPVNVLTWSASPQSCHYMVIHLLYHCCLCLIAYKQGSSTTNSMLNLYSQCCYKALVPSVP